MVAVVPAAFSHTALLNLTVKAVVVEAEEEVLVAAEEEVEVVEVVVVSKRYLKQAAFIPNLSSLKLMQ